MSGESDSLPESARDGTRDAIPEAARRGFPRFEGPRRLDELDEVDRV